MVRPEFMQWLGSEAAAQQLTAALEDGSMTKEAFVAIRKDETGEWMDTDTLEVLLDMAKENAAKRNAANPGWAKANPVKRIVRVRIEVAD